MKINCLIKFFVLLSGLLFSFGGQAAITDSSVQALKAFYTSTGGSGWTDNSGWTAADIGCGAKGIVCDINDNVVELLLDSNNLVGTIPPEIGDLTNLVRLKLQNNALTGQIPVEMGNLPNLVELLLYNNQLEGPVPASIGGLSKLMYFQVNNNRLSGSIPAELGNLSKMYTFYLDANQFLGELPSNLLYIGSLSATLYIDLKWNAVFSNDSTLNTFINQHPVGTYEPSQTTPPTGVVRISKTTTSVELQWDAFDTTPSTPGGYKILQATSVTGPYSQVGPDIDNRSVTSTTINNLLEGVNYWFKVCNYTSNHANNLKNVVISNDSDAVSKGVPAVGAGVDQFVNELLSVNLSSTASDSDGTVVSYLWDQLSGAAVVLTGTNSASASFTAPEVSNGGDILTFRVTVTDNDGDIAHDDVQITVNNVLVAPTVSAGLNQIVNEGDAVSLTATAGDPNGTIVSYLWKLDEGPAVTVTINGQSTANASFTAPGIDTPSETFLFSVTVTDNDGGIATDSIMVTVNNAPTVSAGTDQIVNEGDAVTLSSMASEGNGSIVSYYWEQVSGPGVSISGQASANAGFTAPGIDTESAILKFKVTVTDNNGATATDNVQVTVSNVVLDPTVSAGVDQSVNEGNPVTLSAVADDGNGSIVSYLWEKVSGPAVSMTGHTTANVTFNAPLIGASSEILEFKVTVTDNDGGTATDTILVTVNNVPIAPTVDAGTDQTVNEGAAVTLSATASDINGSIVSYSWSQVPGSVVTLSATSTASVSFEAPQVTEAGDVLVFEVTVTDNEGLSATDQVQVIVNDVMIPPEVDTSTDQPGDEAEEESWIEMFADAHDIDGEIVEYYWEQLEGLSVSLETIDAPRTRFQAPHTNGNRSVRLLFRVTVTDDDGQTATSEVYVIITKKNIVIAGGGALGWPWLLLLGMPLLGRRFLK